MRKMINGERFVMGTCYYPEHWDSSMWEDDLERMLQAGIEVVRVAEFAWNKIEPEEGVYTYEFFDAFLDLAHKKGMKVIFCTHTATPPIWLTEKYPEVLNADQNGLLYRHGARRHYNYNSPVYQKLCRNIVEKSASHYGGVPEVPAGKIWNRGGIESGMGNHFLEPDLQLLGADLCAAEDGPQYEQSPSPAGLLPLRFRQRPPFCTDAVRDDSEILQRG